MECLIGNTVGNTYFIGKSGLRLAVIPGTDKTASGDLFWDDGESIDTIGRNRYNNYTFDLQKDCTLDMKVEKSGYKTNQTLTSIVVLGTNGDRVEVTVDGFPIASELVNKMLVFRPYIDLMTKSVGQKWTLKWRSLKDNSCNIL